MKNSTKGIRTFTISNFSIREIEPKLRLHEDKTHVVEFIVHGDTIDTFVSIDANTPIKLVDVFKKESVECLEN